MKAALSAQERLIASNSDPLITGWELAERRLEEDEAERIDFGLETEVEVDLPEEEEEDELEGFIATEDGFFDSDETKPLRAATESLFLKRPPLRELEELPFEEEEVETEGAGARIWIWTWAFLVSCSIVDMIFALRASSTSDLRLSSK